MEVAANTNRIEAGLSTNWFADLVDGAKTKLRQFAAYRHTMAELSALDDRDVRDLGLSRSMFRELAREAARNA